MSNCKDCLTVVGEVKVLSNKIKSLEDIIHVS